MIGNAFKVAFRSFSRHPLYASINIGGLAAGLACTILILTWVRDELSYDRFHPDAERVYRMNWDFKTENSEGVGPGTPPPLAATLARNVPGIAAATRLRGMGNAVVRSEEKYFSEGGIVAADSNFFEVFRGFELLRGDPKRALSGPNRVVLTEETARKYFGDTPAVGRFLTIGADGRSRYGAYQSLFTVTGVVRTPPHNSHIRFAMLTSMPSHPEVVWFDWSWMWMQMATYVKLDASSSLFDVQARARDAVNASLSASRRGISLAEIQRNNWRWDFVFQPLTGVYLGSMQTGNRLGPAGNRLSVYLFATIAGFILLIACVNFMNLATARSATRVREVGIRKVLGSDRKTLVAQFLAESLFCSALAMPVAVLLVEALIGPFNDLSGKEIRFSLIEPLWLPAALAGLTLLVGLVAGSYPSLYLSGFLPAQAFRRTVNRGARRWSFRNLLVLFQFTVAIALIACTMLVARQLSYVGNADLGFRKEGVVVISNMDERLGERLGAFREKLRSHPEVVAASVSTGVPPQGIFEDSYTAEGLGDRPFDLGSYLADEDLTGTLGIEIVQGRGFSPGSPANADGVLLNEAAVRYIGWKDPVGRTITYPGGGNRVFRVIGVMRDFNFMTLYSPITPFAIFHTASGTYNSPSSSVVVRIARENVDATLRLLEADWKEVSPATPFEYEFLDASLESQYEAEHRFGRIFLVFSALTIFIAGFGLLGLVSYSTEQRTKEIGVRKVLGASVSGIVGLFSKEYIRLILIANVFAWPAAWFVMDRWLEDFAYKIEIGWWTFAASGALALVIALATVGVQASRAATANPVESLRYE